jgi:hypothetical protein
MLELGLLDPEDVVLTPAEIAAHERELEAARIDGTRMLLETGPAGERTILHMGDGADEFVLERVVDVEPVLEWCKGRYNEGIANRHCEFRHMGSFPPEVLELWGIQRYGRGGLPDGWYYLKDYHHLVIEAAHDRDLAGFRTLHGDFRRRGEG